MDKLRVTLKEIEKKRIQMMKREKNAVEENRRNYSTHNNNKKLISILTSIIENSIHLSHLFLVEALHSLRVYSVRGTWILTEKR